jgi:hypothetical protein
VARAAEAFARLDLALADIERTDVPRRPSPATSRAMHPSVTDFEDLDELIGPQGREMIERAADTAP